MSALYENILKKFPTIEFVASYDENRGINVHVENVNSILKDGLESFCSNFLSNVNSESQDMIVEYAELGFFSFYKMPSRQWFIVLVRKQMFPLLNLEVNRIRRLHSSDKKKATENKKSIQTQPESNDEFSEVMSVQKSILPDFSIMDNYFEKHFLYYLPKKSIGGDLYWFKETKNSFYILLGDCTGYGIEGAKRTISLEKIFQKQNYSKDTKSLLLGIHESISREGRPLLASPKFSIETQVVVCRYNKAAGTVSIATTGVSVLHIELTGEFHLIKTKGLQHSKLKEVKIESIDLNVNKGDKLVFYTDGLSNQFDLTNKKKLSNRGVRNIFSQMNGNFSYDAFSKKFLDWKGDTSQEDDISVIGIEF